MRNNEGNDEDYISVLYKILIVIIQRIIIYAKFRVDIVIRLFFDGYTVIIYTL